jgi:hypothetical protein
MRQLSGTTELCYSRSSPRKPQPLLWFRKCGAAATATAYWKKTISRITSSSELVQDLTIGNLPMIMPRQTSRSGQRSPRDPGLHPQQTLTTSLELPEKSKEVVGWVSATEISGS